MSDEDIEVIPILDDVVVPGQLDKAVSGNIDLNDLGSIERFDGAEETTRDEGSSDPIGGPDLDDSPYEEFIEENLTEALPSAPSQQALLFEQESSEDEPEDGQQDNIAALDDAVANAPTPVAEAQPAVIDDSATARSDIADDAMIQRAVDRAVTRLIPVIDSLLREEIRSILKDIGSENDPDQDTT